MRILVLHQHYWPEIAATAQVLTDLCEDLASFGHDVTVVCGQPSYRTLTNERQTACEVRNGVTIRRVWSYTPVQRTIPRRLMHYGSYFASSLVHLLSSERPDVCFVMSTPPLLLGVSGTLARLLRGVPFVYSVQDLYPDVAVHLAVIEANGLAARTIELAARTFYGAASALVTLSSGMASRLSEKGLPRDRIHVIPNWADTSSIRPEARDNSFAREHGLCDRFVVQYSGNLGLSQGLGSILAAADLLRELPVTFVMIGDGNARAALVAEIAERALPNVLLLPPQPRERLSLLLGACDVGLVTMKRGVGNDLVPSKLYGIMAAGRPVLAAVEHGSEVARVVEADRCGWVVAPETPSELAEQIRAAYAMPVGEREALGRNARAACVELYTRKSLTRQYERVLLEVVGAAR